MSATGTGSIFIDTPDGQPAILVETAVMQMEASQTPVLVRRDREGTWWVVAQGPPGVIRAHPIAPLEAIVNGYPDPWTAALALAERAAAAWRHAAMFTNPDRTSGGPL